jgi:hypothetical protein
MVIHLHKRAGFVSARRTTRSGRWLVLATVVLALPGAQAAAPLENRRTVDPMILRSKAPDPAPSVAAGAEPGSPGTAAMPEVPRLAGLTKDSLVAAGPRPSDPIARARKAIADCRVRYAHVRDYTCTFVKRERIDDRLTPQHIMHMKARTNPNSIYFRFQQPNQGREAIYVHGRNNGRIVAHDVGLTKFLAGTMHLDPRGSMAMEDNRHPVTEAGIGSLIDTVARHWAVELTPGESQLTFHDDVRLGNRHCTVIESVHPERGPDFLFHKVKLYIDQEHGLPIRFEAYDWPRHTSARAELVEEYSYLDLKINVGLHDQDFDPANRQYSFGRL